MTPETYQRGFLQTSPIDRKLARSLFNDLYANIGLAPPTITVVRSPIDLVWSVSRHPEAGKSIFARLRGKRKLKEMSDSSPLSFTRNLMASFAQDTQTGNRGFWYDTTKAGYAALGEAVEGPMLLASIERCKAAKIAERIATCSPIWFATEKRVFVCDRPMKVSVNPALRFQSRDGKPAIEYRDGVRIYADQGVFVPRSWATPLDYIHLRNFMAYAQQNSLRELAFRIDVYGRERFCSNFCGSHVRSKDGFGTLHSTEHMYWNDLGKINFLEVENSTPNKNGVKEKHFLRVPPGMRSALQAVAWTFGMTGKEYKEQLVGEA